MIIIIIITKPPPTIFAILTNIPFFHASVKLQHDEFDPSLPLASLRAREGIERDIIFATPLFASSASPSRERERDRERERVNQNIYMYIYKIGTHTSSLFLSKKSSYNIRNSVGVFLWRGSGWRWVGWGGGGTPAGVNISNRATWATETAMGVGGHSGRVSTTHHHPRHI